VQPKVVNEDLSRRDSLDTVGSIDRRSYSDKGFASENVKNGGVFVPVSIISLLVNFVGHPTLWVLKKCLIRH